jgi:hypothetical protein
MKTISTVILAVVLTLTLAGSKVCYGQTVAAGNVAAEIIESVGAAFQPFTNFELGLPSSAVPLVSGQNSPVSDILDLGAITINSGRDISCNIVVIKTSLSDSQGNGFTMEPSARIDPYVKSGDTQTIHLEGKANLARSQLSGLYRGTYQVVVAYN